MSAVETKGDFGSAHGPALRWLSAVETKGDFGYAQSPDTVVWLFIEMFLEMFIEL